jgi:hypothetical protein
VFVILGAARYSSSMRVVLALWAGAIYVFYWLGYLRGQP